MQTAIGNLDAANKLPKRRPILRRILDENTKVYEGLVNGGRSDLEPALKLFRAERKAAD